MFEFNHSFPGLFPMMLLKIGTAVLCGILLGIEREVKDKPAGLRTIVLITVGSTLYMIVSQLLPLISGGPEATTRADPSRIAAQVVTGIGFLGAGAIIQARGAIHGLTTAAVIWVAAGIGLCVGAGFPLLALAVTVLVLTALVAMDPLRRLLSRRADARHLVFRLPNDAIVLSRVELLMQQYDVRTSEYTVAPAEDRELEVSVALHAESEAASRFLEALSSLPGIHGRTR